MKHTLKIMHLPGDGDLIISQPSVDDAAEIIHFLNKVGGETDYLTFGLNEFPLSLEEEKQTILECLEQKSCLMLIAKVGNEIVSHLFLQRSNRPRLAHIGDVGVSVSKQWWGKSIGKHMMLFAIEWARQNSITKIQLQVRTDNERAILLYRKLGFVIEGTLKQAMKVNDTYFDDHLMGLQL